MSQTISRWSPRGQRVEAEAEPLRRAGGEVLHQDVGAIDELPEDRPCLRVLEVEGHALLRPVAPEEVRRLPVDALVVGAREVAAARALDLDHPGAEVGELAGAERGGDRVLERDDGEAGKGAHPTAQNP